MRNCVMIKLLWVEFRLGYLDAVLSTTGRRCLGKILFSWGEVIWTVDSSGYTGNILFCMVSGFRREAVENCSLLGYYAVSSGSSLSTFREGPSVLSL